MAAAPKPCSVYRGQAKTGRGEGPNKPIAHGEQYLSGTADELYNEGLLQAIRPWLTLDSESADHNQLGDSLEGWSYFAQDDWLFVVRLVSAGIYDRRAAYVSHARAWPLDECRQLQFDPAVYLGCSAVFDPPRDENQPAGVSDGALSKYPAQTMPEAWNLKLQAEAAVAVQFLGHLLQSLEQGYPLLIQAPLEDFTAGSALSTLVAFAHAALPYGLKQGCAVRLYTRHPERFARHLNTQLIVLPGESARDAFAASPRNATLLDRNGGLITGTALEPAFEVYAEVATDGALGAPHALLPFSAYLGRNDRSILWRSGNGQWLQLAYLIAMALAGDTDYRAGMFRHHILPQAADGLPWDTLLSDAEWLEFLTPDLAAFILSPADTSAAQALQDAAAQALQRGAKTLDDGLANVWRIDDPRQIQRLLELLAEYPALLTPAVVARHTAAIPLSRLQGISPLHGLLQMELDAGVLGRRSTAAEGLAKLAEEPDNYKVLMAATRNGQLDLNWARYLLNNATPERLRRLALDVLENPRQWPAWGNELLDRLQAQPEILDQDIRAAIIGFGNTLDILGDWDTYIRLADLLEFPCPNAGVSAVFESPVPVKPETGDSAANPLATRLWTQLSAAEDIETRKKLLDLALDTNWKCLTPSSLFTPDGGFKLPTAWCEEAELAECLLNNDSVLEKLDVSRLLQSLWYANPRLGDGRVLKVYKRVAQCWRDKSQTTTDALVLRETWYGWRRSVEAGLSKEELRKAALEWLRCPYWTKPSIEATLEAWKQVVRDLTPDGLSGADMQSLRAGSDHQGGPLWPRIPPFEEQQMQDIAKLATDLAMLAEFAEAMSNNDANECDKYLELIFDHYRSVNPSVVNFPYTGLRWIIGSLLTSAPPLTLAHSSYLYAHSGHRQEKMLEARRLAVLENLASNPSAALVAADKLNLWGDEKFNRSFTNWLGGKIDENTLRQLDEYFSQNQKTALEPTSQRVQLAGKLANDGYMNIAKYLNKFLINSPYHTAVKNQQTPSPAIAAGKILPDNLSGKILEHILSKNTERSLWMQFSPDYAQQNGFVRCENDDPLLRAAKYNDEKNILSSDCRKSLVIVISAHPRLLEYMLPDSSSLPIFELYSSMEGQGTIKRSIANFLDHVCNKNHVLLTKPQWWIAFLNSVKHRCELPDNRLEIAETSIYDSFNIVLQSTNVSKYGEIKQAIMKALANTEGFNRLVNLLRR